MLEHDTFAHELEAPLLTDTDHGALEIVAPRERMQRAQRTQVSHALILLVCALVVLVSVTLWTQPGSTGHDRQVSLCTEQAKRREWRSLTTLEKQEYIDAVLCLRTQKSILHPRQSRYDDFPYIHAHVGNATHDTAGFLPWHRYFVHVYETALRKECNYTGVMTYWDWTLDWADFRNAPIWDPSIGFGGDGGKHAPQSVGQGRCVTDGPFAGLEALYNNRRLESHCLSRGFPGPSEMKRWTNGLQPRLVEEVMALEDYQDFYLELENGPHLAIPYSVRGDFYSFSAPYDPVFFLHHTQLDRLWWLWQQSATAKKVHCDGEAWDGSGRIAHLDDVLDMGGLADAVSVKQVLDTKSFLLCYQY